MKKLLLLFAFGFFSIAAFSQKNNLAQYTGVFKFTGAPFEKIDIKLSDSTLLASAEEMGEGEIEATDVKDVFNEPQNDAELKYIRDENGMIVKLQVSAGGMYWEGVKEVADLNELTGTFKMDEASSLDEVSIVLNDGNLRIDTSMGSSGLVASDEKDVFFLSEVDGKVGFQRGADGKVNKITIVAMGQVFDGKKKEK